MTDAVIVVPQQRVAGLLHCHRPPRSRQRNRGRSQLHYRHRSEVLCLHRSSVYPDLQQNQHSDLPCHESATQQLHPSLPVSAALHWIVAAITLFGTDTSYHSGLQAGGEAPLVHDSLVRQKALVQKQSTVLTNKSTGPSKQKAAALTGRFVDAFNRAIAKYADA